MVSGIVCGGMRGLVNRAVERKAVDGDVELGSWFGRVNTMVWFADVAGIFCGGCFDVRLTRHKLKKSLTDAAKALTFAGDNSGEVNRSSCLLTVFMASFRCEVRHGVLQLLELTAHSL